MALVDNLKQSELKLYTLNLGMALMCGSAIVHLRNCMDKEKSVAKAMLTWI